MSKTPFYKKKKSKETVEMLVNKTTNLSTMASENISNKPIQATPIEHVDLDSKNLTLDELLASTHPFIDEYNKSLPVIKRYPNGFDGKNYDF